MEKDTSTFPPSQYPLHQEPCNLEDEVAKKVKQLQLSLPNEKIYTGNIYYYYQNFWCPDVFLPAVISIQDQFQAQDTDIIIVSIPKSGTTWLKALAFSILNRRIYPTNNQDPLKPHPLLTSNPHELVSFLEIQTRSKFQSELLCPRLLATHLPYHALPESMKKSGCRIVYICRNVLDSSVSKWKFLNRRKEAQNEEKGITGEKESSLEEHLDCVCKGVDAFGPYWDHVLGYWQESLRRPNKILFMKYEDVKGDEKSEMKRLAEFIGCPFSLQEEESGVIEEISKLCSFDNLKELEVNKSGKCGKYVENSAYFRKGKVGDWKNYMTASVADHLQNIVQEKLQGSGLFFKYDSTDN